jgi:hypothetical protein
MLCAESLEQKILSLEKNPLEDGCLLSFKGDLHDSMGACLNNLALHANRS